MRPTDLFSAPQARKIFGPGGKVAQRSFQTTQQSRDRTRNDKEHTQPWVAHIFLMPVKGPHAEVGGTHFRRLGCNMHSAECTSLYLFTLAEDEGKRNLFLEDVVY